MKTFDDVIVILKALGWTEFNWTMIHRNQYDLLSDGILLYPKGFNRYFERIEIRKDMLVHLPDDSALTLEQYIILYT